MENSDQGGGEDPLPGDLPAGRLGERIVALRQAIWARRPILGEIVRKHGEKTLHRYSQDFLDVNPSPRLDMRKPELIAAVQELVEGRLGPEVARGVAAQLTRLALVSTQDHHGPIVHPFFVNANILSAVPSFHALDPDLRYLVVFSFASVSLNNSSSPRGLLFHGGLNGSGNLLKLPLFPDKLKMGTIYGMRPFTRQDLARAEQELARKEREGKVARGRGEKIRSLLERCCGAPDVLGAANFASQVTRMNFHLWPRLFHSIADSGTPPHASFQRRIPDLVYLDIETLVSALLRKHHLANPPSLLHHVLFHPDWRSRVLRYFDGLPGGFSRERQSGTYLFWARDTSGHRVRLWLDGDALWTWQGERTVGWNPEELHRALEERSLFPSMLFCYLVVSLYYGMKCLGGFCQVHDLTVAKQAWMALLRELGEAEEAEAVVPVQTKELGGDGLVLAYLRTPKGDLVPATGIDMAIEEADTTYENFVELSKTITLAEAMGPMLPDMYTVLTAAAERDPELSALTPERILEETGVQAKLMHTPFHFRKESAVALEMPLSSLRRPAS